MKQYLKLNQSIILNIMLAVFNKKIADTMKNRKSPVWNNM